jgi:hypothetical protein
MTPNTRRKLQQLAT